MTVAALKRRLPEQARARAVDTRRLERLVAAQPLAARALKRGFDILVAGLGLCLTGPLLLLLAALIRLETRGPALFVQPRMGRGQRPFVIGKLRTMDARGRVTRIGRLLRPTGLDELPQLWHVLTGEMSLIGPRPEVLDRVPRWQREIPWYGARHLMRPGITGWAQVNGLRGDRSFIPERVRLDLEYISSWSLRLDLRILLLTVTTIWRDTRRG
jgi:lipopolysaccharide/colanic/teichoic acid biosynthesis glycosyltransferase